MYTIKIGWNNNPDCLQLKYAYEILRNALSASKNANYQTLTNDSKTIIPFFHTKKHNVPFTEAIPPENSTLAIPEFFCTQLINSTT